MSFIPALIGPVSKLLDQFIEDKDLSKKLKQEIELEVLKNKDELTRIAADVVKSEAQSEHWIVAAWRPILMLTITAIVAVHYLIFPIAAQFGLELALELPSELWNLLTIGVGGYVVGRSGEKMVKEYKNGG